MAQWYQLMKVEMNYDPKLDLLDTNANDIKLISQALDLLWYNTSVFNCKNLAPLALKWRDMNNKLKNNK